MPSPSLCKKCSHIPFDAELKTLRSKEYSGRRSWSLGTFGELRARKCPFCELVAPICTSRRASWEAFTPPIDSEVVAVRWGPGYIDAECFDLGSYIGISGDLDDSNTNYRSTYYARTKFNEFIDFKEVRRWTLICDQEHGNYGSQCRPTTFNLAILPRIGKRQLDFRVIDVKNMCIVYAPPQCRYLALSYVWGVKKGSRLVLTTQNEETLMQPEALTNARALIPNTIPDAITVVRKLKEKYLWVDSLCLTQDDTVELQECVAVMDLFYEMAVLTIIAADGEDAWAGLRGVEPTPRQLNRRARKIVPGLNMTTIKDMDALLRRSKYSSRAWTMQEEIISPRPLVFIDSQVYDRCGDSYYSEVLNWPGKPLRDLYTIAGSLYHSIFSSYEADFEDFSIILMYYMLRKLSYESDILRASQGMLRKFSALSGLHCLEGLPSPLDRSLLFEMSSRFTSPDLDKFGRREGFPSYSWTGWKNPSAYSKFLEVSDIHNHKPVDGNSQMNSGLCCWIIWHCKLEDGNINRISNTGRLRKSPLPKPEDSKLNARRQFQDIPVAASDVEIGMVCTIFYPFLLFWTICINLRLERTPRVNGLLSGLVNYYAMDKFGKSCGTVTMDTIVPEMTEGKFALLAATEDKFWALMLVWKDEVAERRGVVELSKSALNGCLPPGLRWKAIVLG